MFIALRGTPASIDLPRKSESTLDRLLCGFGYWPPYYFD